MSLRTLEPELFNSIGIDLNKNWTVIQSKKIIKEIFLTSGIDAPPLTITPSTSIAIASFIYSEIVQTYNFASEATKATIPDFQEALMDSKHIQSLNSELNRDKFKRKPNKLIYYFFETIKETLKIRKGKENPGFEWNIEGILAFIVFITFCLTCLLQSIGLAKSVPDALVRIVDIMAAFLFGRGSMRVKPLE